MSVYLVITYGGHDCAILKWMDYYSYGFIVSQVNLFDEFVSFGELDN